MDGNIHADHLATAGESAGGTGATHCFGHIASVRLEHATIKGGDDLSVGNRRIDVIRTLGHTPEGITRFVHTWFLLSGDTLVIRDISRINLPDDESDSNVGSGGNDSAPEAAASLCTPPHGQTSFRSGRRRRDREQVRMR